MHGRIVASFIALFCAAQSAELGAAAAQGAAAAAAVYDPLLSLSLVYYTAASYCNDRAQIASWTCKFCFANNSLTNVTVIWNSTSQIQGFVGWDAAAARAVVAFRGSVGALDWLEDFDFTLTPVPGCPGCNASHGFLHSCFYSIYPQLTAALAALPAGAPVLLTGHSLGAAVAELAAWHLAAAGAALEAVYTYGTPRVGNAAWARAWGAAVGRGGAAPAFRVIHFEDPVPHLPLELMGFVHPPTEVFYGSEAGGAWRQCSSSNGEDAACSNSVLPVDAKDHDTYLGVGIDSCND